MRRTSVRRENPGIRHRALPRPNKKDHLSEEFELAHGGHFATK